MIGIQKTTTNMRGAIEHRHRWVMGCMMENSPNSPLLLALFFHWKMIMAVVLTAITTAEAFTTSTSPTSPSYHGDSFSLSAHHHYRSYPTDIVHRLQKLCQNQDNSQRVLELIQYGALSHNPTRYPLLAVRSKSSASAVEEDSLSPSLLVTAGVHGSERSGIDACLNFLEQSSSSSPQIITRGAQQEDQVEFVVVPCVSPWSYEWGTRCQANRKDPNRSFNANSNAHPNPYQTEEAQALMSFLNEQTKPHSNSKNNNNNQKSSWTCHLDLHETRPGGQDHGGAFDILLGQGDNGGRVASPVEEEWMMRIDPVCIPNGVFLVVDQELSASSSSSFLLDQEAFQRSVLHSMQTVLPIVQRSRNSNHHQNRSAPTTGSRSSTTIFDRIDDNGLLRVPTKALGMCSSATEACYVATTEVCRSMKATMLQGDDDEDDELYIQAQFAAITGALFFLQSRAASSSS